MSDALATTRTNRERLEALEVFYSIELSTAADSALANLVSAMAPKKERKHGPHTCLVETSTLSADEQFPFFLYFHIDRVEADEDEPGSADSLFLHVNFSQKPASAPPPAMLARRDAGHTVEWVVSELRHVFPAAGDSAIFQARARLEPARAPRPGLIAPPLRTGDALLELTGAEYRSTGGKGVRSFRWSNRDGRTLAWLSYTLPLTPDLWEAGPAAFLAEEEQRCLGLIRELL